MRSRRIVLSIAPLAIAALALTACSGTAAPGEEAPSEDALVIYNAQHEQLTEEWVAAFTDETGIEVVLRNGNDSELGNQLVEEGDASRADVFLTENSPAMSLVENAGLLAPVDQATLDLVPEQYRPSSGLWTGIAARSTVFVYNPELLDESELPASLMDLQNEEWKGRWGAAPGGADFQAIVSAVLELEGADATSAWLDGMKQNASIYQNNIATMKAVNAGEVPGGVIYHYYWYRDQDGTQENSAQHRAALLRQPGPGRVRERLGRRRAQVECRIRTRRSSSSPSWRARPASRSSARATASSTPSPATCRRSRPCPRSTHSTPRPSTRRPSTDPRSSTS